MSDGHKQAPTMPELNGAREQYHILPVPPINSRAPWRANGAAAAGSIAQRIYPPAAHRDVFGIMDNGVVSTILSIAEEQAYSPSALTPIEGVRYPPETHKATPEFETPASNAPCGNEMMMALI